MIYVYRLLFIHFWSTLLKQKLLECEERKHWHVRLKIDKLKTVLNFLHKPELRASFLPWLSRPLH